MTYEDIDTLCGFCIREGLCSKQCEGCMIDDVWRKMYYEGKEVDDAGK